MDDTTDGYCFESDSLNEPTQANAVKNLKYFSDNNAAPETSAISKSQFNMSSHPQLLFKIPSLDKLSLMKGNVKNIKSPSRKVQAGRIRDSKISQPKLSLVPRPSFINSSKLSHCSRSSQVKKRKDLLKKMAFLAECTLKENQMKQSTPVKPLAGLTPKKTPRSGSYFVIPEFKKKVTKLDEIRTPIQAFVRKEVFSYCEKSTNQKTPLKCCENKIFESNSKNKEEITEQILPETETKLKQVLSHCKSYSKAVTTVHERLRGLDEAFENRLNEIPEYKVYNEFCIYQLKRDDLHRDLKKLEEDFRNSITTKMSVSNKLRTFMREREKCFNKQDSLLKDFEQVVQTTLDKYSKVDATARNIEESDNQETPKLRRSLRLSEVSKKNEKAAPVTKKLTKLDKKSGGIQKCRRL